MIELMGAQPVTVQAADHAMYRAKAEHYEARNIERRKGFENL